MDILQIAALAVFLTIACLIVRQYKPEYAVVMQIGAFCAVVLMLFSYIEGLLKAAQSIVEISQINIDF
ncbi:MAG: hypothetical protein LBH71_01990, partial [Oscillospiraceae bacterium]|nr:hypothetical protein [Oscillospiraceae bacterium]